MNQKDVERAKDILTEKKEEFNGLMESCEFPLPMREVGTFVEALGVAIACMELQVVGKCDCGKRTSLKVEDADCHNCGCRLEACCYQNKACCDCEVSLEDSE